MAFANILGNDRLMQNLSASIRKNRFSHFYLISGPEGSGKHTLADYLAGALLCTGEKKPCGECSACRKVLAKSHPDYITVDDPEHKTVAVKVIREARESIFVRPNESERKVYLFPQEMGIEGQNALLKVLEEPPSYGVFIILSNNPEKLLPTVRSRCTELNLSPVSAQVLRPFLAARFPQAATEDLDAVIRRSGGYTGQAMALLENGTQQAPEVAAFAEAFTAKDQMGLLRVIVPMEKWKRDQVLPVFAAWIEVLQEALVCRSGIPASTQVVRALSAARSSNDLMGAIRKIQKAMEYTQGNVSVAAVCGWLVHALK